MKRCLNIGALTVAEMVELLQALPAKCRNLPIYCCGSDEVYLCINEEDGYIVIDEEDLFWEDDGTDNFS